VRKGCRNVHMITPNQRECISVLYCINASGQSIPNFYIFRGKQRTRNFLKKTSEKDDVRDMQSKAWMTNALFKEWMLHFLHTLSTDHDLSTENRHFFNEVATSPILLSKL